MDSEKTEKLLSLTEVAARLEVTRKRALVFIQQKRLAAEMVGKTYVIRESDVAEFEKNNPREPGRPLAENPTPAALAKRRQRERDKLKGK